MSKYTKMVQVNKERNKAKEESALWYINDLEKKKQQVTVAKLVKLTGLSKSFFYSNTAVCRELKRVQNLQKDTDFVKPQKVAIEKAMIRENELLKQIIREKDAEIVRLKKENEKLKKAAEANDISILRKL